MAKHRKTIEERVGLARQLYAMTNTRPLLGFFCGSEYPLHRYSASRTLPGTRPLVPDDFPVAPYVENACMLFEEHEKCGGDLIYAASAFWGIPWIEAAVGCPIVADHETGSISSRHPAGFEGGFSIPEFSPENGWVRKLGEFLDAIAKASQGRFPLATTRLRGVSDLLTAIWGSENLIFRMMENPEVVKRYAEQLSDWIIRIAEYQIEKIPEFHGGIGSFYYHLWAPRGTVWLQEDATALLSPGLCKGFIAPHFSRICESLENAIVHIHPSGFVPWEMFLSAPLKLYELHLDEGGASAKKLVERYRTILGKSPLLIWGRLSEEDLKVVFQELSPRGVAVMTVVSSPEEAAEIYGKWCGGR